MIAIVLLILVVAGVLAVLIQRDLERAARRRRLARLSTGMVRVTLVLNDSFTPAMKRAAEAARTLSETLQQIGEALQAEDPEADGEPS